MGKSVFLFCIVFNSFLCILQSQWLADVRLTNDPARSWISGNDAKCIVSDGSLVHVVWYDERAGNFHIYYKRSADGGLTWSADYRLSVDNAEAINPTIVSSGQLLVVIWEDYRNGNPELYFKRSSNAGVNWGSDTRLTNNAAESMRPSAIVTGQSVHAVWYDNRDGNYEIYYRRSTDGGSNWSADTRLTNNSGNSYNPSLSFPVSSASNVLHLAWQDNRDGNYEIYYMRSTNGGLNWSSIARLTNIPGPSIFPCISASGSNVYLTWQDSAYPGTVLTRFKRSIDEGLTWGADTSLEFASLFNMVPFIVSSGLNVHLSWFRHGTYYRISTDAGLTWSATTTITPDLGGISCMSISGTNVHIIWQDFRNNNYEIYYRGNPTGNPIGIQKTSNEIPNQYKLEQNYPNPFNPVTKIKFDIAVGAQYTARVRIVIYDVLGRNIEAIVNEKLAPGSYELSWDASKYPSGIYFYSLFGDGIKIDTKKMMFIK